jgi:dCMP deaminase
MSKLSHQIKKHKLYMDIAHRVAKESYCKRLEVGAIIVKDGNIISFGYNGTPSGMPNKCEENDVTLSYILHAESNAITKACKSTISTLGASMYITHSCCLECARLIIQSGIKEVYYAEEYRSPAGLNLLKNCKIKLTKLTKQ